MSAKLISTKAISKSFNQLVALQRDVPMSLIFYTLVQANAQPCQKLPKNFPDLLPASLRQFIAVKWDENKNEWRYNRDKADKLRERLNITFQTETFESMVDMIDSHLLSKATVEKTDEQQVQSCENSLAKTVAKMLALGLSSGEIQVKLADIILKAQKGQAGASATLTASVKASAANGSLGPV